MNKRIIKIVTFILFILNVTFVSAQYESNYKLVWEENFDNNLNKKIWTPEKNGTGGGNAEFQFYKPQNVKTEKLADGTGCLVLNARRETYKGRPATSGRLNTKGKLTVKYGKIDVRVLIPKTANGLWPAFWLMGDDKNAVGWPKCGEIDVIEMGNDKGIEAGTQNRFFNGACHWGESFNDGNYPNMVQVATSEYSLQDGFHVFTLIWTPDSINMYLDQDKYPYTKPYFAMGIKGDGSANHPSRYFHKPFHLIANLAVGGYFTGLPTPSKEIVKVSADDKNFQKITALPKAGTSAKFYIDYIRIYQNGTPGEEFNIKK